MPFRNNTNYYFLIIILSLLLGCHEEEHPLPAVEINSFTLQGMGIFDFKEDVIFIADSMSEYQLMINTSPDDALISYTLNGSETFNKMDQPVVLNASMTEIAFIAEKERHSRSKIRRITLDTTSTHYLNTVKIQPRTGFRFINLDMNNNTRGTMQLVVYNIQGQRVIERNILKRKNWLAQEIDLSSLKDGMYVLKLTLGNSEITEKLIVNL